MKKKTDECKRDCVLILGGDMMWIICCMLGLTGPNGKAFRKDYLATLSDLEKGKTHSPRPPFNYKSSALSRQTLFHK